MLQTIISLPTGNDYIVDLENPDGNTLVLESNGETTQRLFKFNLERRPISTKATPNENETHGIVLFDTTEHDGKDPQRYVKALIRKIDVDESQDNDLDADEDQDDDFCSINVEVEFVKFENARKNPVNEEPTDNNDLCKIVPYEKKGEFGLFLKRTGTKRKILSTEINITFHYLDNSTSLTIFVTPESKIADAVIDFGSEATQMLVCYRDKTKGKDHIKKVFDLVYKQIENPETATTDFKQFEQYDDNSKLFKSIFYAQQSIKDAEVKTNPVVPSYGEKNQLLRILTTYDESLTLLGENAVGKSERTHIRVPNIKLSCFGSLVQPTINDDIPLSDFKNGYFYRHALNNFLLAALSTTEEHISAVSLFVLMPNVYTQFDIWTNLSYIREDIKKIIQQNKEKLGHIKHVQVDSLSESDASILGVFQAFLMEKNVPEGNYLILDAGKGTLDYSVMRKSNSKPLFTHIYKGGIIGSGAALTTAYIIGFVYDCAKEIFKTDLDMNGIIDLLYTKILDSPKEHEIKSLHNLKSLSELTKYIDEYKKTINAPNAVPLEKSEIAFEIGNTSRGLSQFNLDTLIKFIRKQYVLLSSYAPLSEKAQSYVDTIIEAICKGVVQDLASYPKLSREPIKGIIFAGRAFKHIPLKKRMLEYLRANKLINESAVEFGFGNDDPEIMKRICLYSSPLIVKGEYSQISADVYSNTHRHENETSSTTVSEEDSDWSIRGVDFVKNLFKRKKKSSIEETPQPKDASKAPILGEAKDIFLGKTPLQLPVQHIVKGSNSSLAKGIDLYYNKHKSVTIVAGSKYSMPGDLESGKVKLFFTSDSIILLDKQNETHKLERIEVDLRSVPLSLPTLFPYVYGVDYQNFQNALYQLLKTEKESFAPEENNLTRQTSLSEDNATSEEIPDSQESTSNNTPSAQRPESTSIGQPDYLDML